MPVTETLSEGERYLLAILQDLSGIDLAEFCWHAADHPDGCFRAWPFQWSWWRESAEKQIDQSARSVGKSLSIKVRCFAFPFNFPNQELVVTAPELVHLEPIVSLIENQFFDTRLGREMLKKGRSSVNHRPFMMQFQNGARFIGRIPQRDGRGVKGLHPIRLELDEAQDYPPAGWTELEPTLKRGVEDAQWRAHGVTKGVQGDYYKKTQPGSGWVVHQITAMMRPTWTDEERQEAIEAYGSAEDPDYRRNILGFHGDATNTLFVLRKLVQCVDMELASAYNDDYIKILLRDTDLDNPDDEDAGTTELITKMNLQPVPARYATPGHQVWIGMDVGFTSDPSEILTFVEYFPSSEELAEDRSLKRPKLPKGMSRLRLVSRVALRRISGPLQANVVMHIIEHYNARGFAMDKTGNGLPLFQMIQAKMRAAAGGDAERIAEVAQRVKGYNFSEKVLVEIEEAKAEKSRKRRKGTAKEATNEDIAEEAGIGRNVLEFSTDELRKLVDQARLMLPWDKELIDEFHGQTFSYSNSPIDQYGRRRRIFSEGRFHALDAARMAVMGMVQQPIEEFMDAKPVQEPVIDRPLMY